MFDLLLMVGIMLGVPLLVGLVLLLEEPLDEG